MFWKTFAGKRVIPLTDRSSVPVCLGQEPARTSGAPSESPVKVQFPKVRVQGAADVLDSSTSANRRPLLIASANLIFRKERWTRTSRPMSKSLLADRGSIWHHGVKVYSLPVGSIWHHGPQERENTSWSQEKKTLRKSTNLMKTLRKSTKAHEHVVVERRGGLTWSRHEIIDWCCFYTAHTTAISNYSSARKSKELSPASRNFFFSDLPEDFFSEDFGGENGL